MLARPWWRKSAGSSTFAFKKQDPKKGLFHILEKHVDGVSGTALVRNGSIRTEYRPELEGEGVMGGEDI